MTDNEINIAIAEACGWKDRPDPFYEDRRAWTKDEGATWEATCDIPDYCHDLNAAIQLCDGGWQLHAPFGGHMWKVIAPNRGNTIVVRNLSLSYAVSECYLRTIGKWRDA